MADTKISAATDAGTLLATDMVPVARSGSTTAYHGTMSEIAVWANTNLPVASTSTAGVVKVDGTSITIASGTISATGGALPSSTPPAMDGTASAGALTAYSRGDHVHPNDTSRAPLASPTFTGSPAAPTPTTGDNSTKIATTAFVQAQMVASGAGVSTWNTRAGAVVLQQSDLTALNVYDDAGRNLIMNPTFTVAQRGAGPFSAPGLTLDRWNFSLSTDTGTVYQGAVSDANRTQIGDEAAAYFLQCAFTGTSGAGANTRIYQTIENIRRLAGKTVTVSFWAAASGAMTRLGVNIAQYFGTGGSPSPTTQIAGQSVTLTSGFVRYSLTFSIPSISGLTVGTNNDHCTYPQFWCSSGATNAGNAGNVGVQSGTLFLYGVQLEVGTQATPLDYGGSPQQQLAQCQRFYCTTTSGASGYVGGSGQNVTAFAAFPVAMRAVPTVTANVTSTNASSSNLANTSLNSTNLNFSGSASGYYYWNGTFTASAEL